jgi:hypothetical protein
MTLEEHAAKIVDAILSLNEQGVVKENMIGTIVNQIRQAMKENK